MSPRWTLSLCPFFCAVALQFATGSSLAAPTAEPPASAETAREFLLLQYRADPSCPGAEIFEAHFNARTSRVRLASTPAATSGRLTVFVKSDSAQSRGRLEIAGRDSEVTSREVVGTNCGEVVSVLAFIAAMTLDSEAAASASALPALPTSAERDRAGSGSESEASTAPPAVTTGPALDLAVRTTSAVAAHHPRATELRTTLVEERPKEPWEFAAGASLRAAFGVFPSWAAAPALFIQARRSTPNLSSTLRLALVAAQSRTYENEPGRTQFQWMGAELSGCPARWRLGAKWLASPCLAAQVGALHGQGGGFLEHYSVTRLWSTVGVTGQLQWAFQRRAFLEARASLQFPLTRDRFVIERDGQLDAVHELPLVVPAIELGFGVNL